MFFILRSSTFIDIREPTFLQILENKLVIIRVRTHKVKVKVQHMYHSEYRVTLGKMKLKPIEEFWFSAMTIRNNQLLSCYLQQLIFLDDVYLTL